MIGRRRFTKFHLIATTRAEARCVSPYVAEFAKVIKIVELAFANRLHANDFEFMCSYSLRSVCYQRGLRLLPGCRKTAIENAIRGTMAFLFIRRAAALVTLSHTEDAGQRAHRHRDWWLKKHYKNFTSDEW